MNYHKRKSENEILLSFKSMKINSEIQDEQDRIDRLFKLVFTNVVILRKIYYFIKLQRNKFVIFNNRQQLLNFKSKQYISKIEYGGKEVLQIGDLPTNGLLKHVVLLSKSPNNLIIKNGNVIPNGVEIIDFNFLHSSVSSNDEPNGKLFNLNELPSTIHTVNGLYRNSESEIYIPPNITSVSFINCPFYNNNKGNFIIPNTLKEITLPNLNILLNGDIPEGIEKLVLKYSVTGISKAVLPNSIKELHLNCSHDIVTYNSRREEEGVSQLNILNILPPNVEILNLICRSLKELNRDLSTCTLIKDLTITTVMGQTWIANSFPPNLTRLSLSGFYHTINQGIIPQSVKYLCLNYAIPFSDEVIKPLGVGSLPNGLESLEINMVMDEPNILPESLTYLRITTDSFKNADVDRFISILPPSLTSLILPECFFYINGLKFPNKIKIIDYTVTAYGKLKSTQDTTIDLDAENNRFKCGEQNNYNSSSSISIFSQYQAPKPTSKPKKSNKKKKIKINSMDI